MPDATGAATARLDALGASESLFGETADARQGAVDGDASEDGARGAGAQAAAPAERKVVVSIREGRSTIGVQRTGSNQHVEGFDGRDLPGSAQEIPTVIERAHAPWEDQAKYPAPRGPLLRHRLSGCPGAVRGRLQPPKQGHRNNPGRCDTPEGQDARSGAP